ncbi:PEP-CTERM sorting domain-containing protein [Fundidesulfovibrio putealis]|uniref:PEP-CTERM sorting domain-containing protein n=1 Tax=Fundidesulfovibrio putealis TaxID=270496 RepID=UPI00196A1478|nr:PEP-CTERM sorting domain-containing protein [Fundidesulfovibrio putealis]
MKRAKLILVACALVCSLNIATYARAVVLPNPEVYAISNDMLYTYSAQILTALGYQGFDYSTGSGTQDIAIFTFNNALNNHNLNAGFPVPFQIPNGNPSAWSGTWGDGSGTNAPILVDTLRDYLHSTFGSNINIPVFVFDFNNNTDLFITGQARIWDGAPGGQSSTMIAQFSMDNTNLVVPGASPLPGNNAYDPTSFVTVSTEVQFPYSGTPIIGPIPSSNGSGKADFFAYSPAMDLTLYDNQGYYIDFFFNVAGNTGGGEELFISGRVSTVSAVPEPATMLLMGLGLAGVAVARRRMRKPQ